MESVGGAISSVTSLPLDWLVLGAVVIIIALDSLRSGVGRAISLSVAAILGLSLFSFVGEAVPLNSMDALTTNPMVQAIVFGVMVGVLYFFVRRMGLDYIDGGMGEPIQALIAASATAIVLAIIWLEIPALQELWQLSDGVKSVFSEPFRLWWLLGSFAALAFARG